MNEQEILKGNKLIAEFMDWSYEQQHRNFRYADDTKVWKKCWFDTYGIRRTDKNNPLLFHSSWDWLMPVVEKIETINDLDDGYCSDFVLTATYHIQNWTVSILDNNIEVTEQEGLTKIGTTYKAVVEFIEWYNQNK